MGSTSLSLFIPARIPEHTAFIKHYGQIDEIVNLELPSGREHEGCPHAGPIDQGIPAF